MNREQVEGRRSERIQIKCLSGAVVRDLDKTFGTEVLIPYDAQVLEERLSDALPELR